MATISERIRQLRLKRHGNRGKAAFAREIGVTATAVAQYEDGANPKVEVLQRISEVCNVSLRWLVTGDEDPADALRNMTGPLDPEERDHLAKRFEKILDPLMRGMSDFLEERASGDDLLIRVPPHERPDELARHAWEMPVMIVSARDMRPGESTDFYALPLLDDAVAAGEPREVRERHVSGHCIVHRKWCPHPDESVFLRVQGDSMVPTIPDGAFVCVDTSETEPDALIGRVVLIVTSDGQATIKRLRRTDRREWVGIPDNLSDANRPIYIMEGDRVVGLVRSVHAEVK